MVWKFGAVAGLKDSDYCGASHSMCRLGNKLLDTGIGESYFIRKKAELDQARYCILINFADPLVGCSYKKEKAR